MAKRYPEPLFDTIIEPFAGSAGYSCLYYTKNIILYEIDPVIYSILDFLIKSSSKDIMSLPLIAPGETVNDYNISQEARWLIGMWINVASVKPCLSLSKWSQRGWPNSPMTYWGIKCRERLAKTVDLIKHWKVFNKSYEQCDNIEATWFIDAPYMKKGKLYKFHHIDYKNLASWCENRLGQLIVCENLGADWLPFNKLCKQHGASRNAKTRNSTEAIYHFIK